MFVLYLQFINKKVNRNFITFFFSLIVILSVVSPTINYRIDGINDTFALVDINEAENKNIEMTKDFEIKFLERYNFTSLFKNEGKKFHNYCLQTYDDLYNGITLPPPEFS